MTESAVRRFRALAGPTASRDSGSPPLTWWGMLMLVLTEGALFASFIASYFYLRWYGDQGWPPDGIADPKLARPAAMVAIIVVSGLTIYAALQAVRRGDRTVLLLALAATLALGGAFLGLQAWDYVEKVKEYTPQTNAYGSLVYLLTGAHSAHLAVGVLIGLWVAFRAAAGAYSPQQHVGVSVLALYWLFLVAVGVAVFLTTTVSPYL